MFEYFMDLYRKHACKAEIEQMAIFLDSDLNCRPRFFDFEPHCELLDWRDKITTENLHQKKISLNSLFCHNLNRFNMLIALRL